jgi:hypothetical protein
MTTEKTIRLTRKELQWIERTADIESANAMFKFTQIVQTDLKELKDEEKEMLKKISTELIDLYSFLKELRIKLELWDCRYDIDSEIKVDDKKDEN